MTKQMTLFEETEDIYLKINEAALKANVSTATIRNWVKTGYLKQTGNGTICSKSFEDFIENIAGKEKLNSRANKSLKDEHDHNELTDELLSKLSNDNILKDKLGDEYENSLSNSYRNKEGIYYTPTDIVYDLLSDIEGNIIDNTFCDPSCGSGNFIIQAIDIGFKPENIFGFDTDPIAVEITKKRIYEKTGYESKNIFVQDFLEFASRPNKQKFDFIYTNPPWGKKIQKRKKEVYAKIFQTKNCLDTSALFFFGSLHCLNKDGYLGFLLPEAFFNISVFEAAREKALSLKIKKLIDYGKSFKGLVTRAQAIILQNSNFENRTYSIKCIYNGKSFERSLESFNKLPKSILNFYCSNSESEVISHIYSLPHITLKNKAKWGLGIVTGNNSKYCKSNIEEGYIPIFKGSDITPDVLKKPTNFIPEDTSFYQQVAPLELYKSKDKLIYKFISSNLCFFYDTEQRFILNSANMLILNENFPISGKMLADVLNCKIINWIFKNIFNTHKILRSDLESLPIHIEYMATKSEFKENDFLKYLEVEGMPDGTYRIKK